MRRFADTATDRINSMIRLDSVWWTTPASHFLLGIRSGIGGSTPLEVDSFAAVQLIEMARMKMMRIIAPHTPRRHTAHINITTEIITNI